MLYSHFIRTAPSGCARRAGAAKIPALGRTLARCYRPLGPVTMEAAAGKRERPVWPKKKVAMMLGYCGTGYQGMQLNPGARTIEAELFKALCAEGLVSEDNQEDPRKSAWMRACRTDKGVHAAGQVVSLKMLLKGEAAAGETGDLGVLERLVAGLNGRLPEQIRVFGIKRVTNTFQAKERTDSRVYEYLLPTYVFEAIAPAVYRDATPRPFRERPAAAAGPADGEAPEPAPFVPEISAEQRARAAAFRIDAETLGRVRGMFKEYVGSHLYHNFTIGMTHKDFQARRNILDVWLEAPFCGADGTEWVRVKFHGQSFMLHQIRKMVGLVIMAVRLGVGAAIVRRCFGEAKVNIPRAPALGLLLDYGLYELYNTRNPEHARIDFKEYEPEREQLKQLWIYPRIHGEEAEFARFWGWLKCNDDHAAEFAFLLQ